jgi:hypothetical protein
MLNHIKIRFGFLMQNCITIFVYSMLNFKNKIGLTNAILASLIILISGKYSEAQATVRKHPISIALSNRVLEKIDKEASKQKRSSTNRKISKQSEYCFLSYK